MNYLVSLARILGAFAVIVVVFLFLFVDSRIALLIFALATGWAQYLYNVLPSVRMNWSTLISTMVCLIMFSVGAHQFCSWLYRNIRSHTGDSIWKIRWSLIGISVIFLMFIAGTAAVGVAHQMVFLATSDEPMWKDSPRHAVANRIKCLSNLRMIGQVMQLYAHANEGRLPESFQQLFDSGTDLSQEQFLCPQDPRAEKIDTLERRMPPRLSYAYLGKGLKWSLDRPVPIVIEALPYHEDGVNVLYSDGRADFLDLDEAVKIQVPSKYLSPATQPNEPTPPLTSPFPVGADNAGTSR